eukprot:TRINITY_DN8303_c0_g1_i1.p1 TRINITY_DN8303_c0_g1~~TRINITY_DN8303_c0_g1_i1.p1  ORF type:complete len:401 (+),score=139.29 TRINITY_DN8303_c0_g1_i1:85-1287(+)
MAYLSKSAQRRCFMTPPLTNGMQTIFAQHFRGRGMKRRDQVIPEFAPHRGHHAKYSGEWKSTYGAHLRTPKRAPDIDDPRPPVVGWITHVLDADGTLPIMPYDNHESKGRKVLQGLYKDFKEMYNQHYTIVPLYGGGAWDPREHTNTMAFFHRSATVAGCIKTEAITALYPKVVIRGDLNEVVIRMHSIIMEGVVITTDGHPRNTNLPGRISRLNEGTVTIGRYTIIHPNCHIDSAHISDYCEIGEGCKIGYNALMELGSSLEPGSVLLAHQRVPRFEIWAGNPARKVGNREKNLQTWTGYVDLVEKNQAKGIIDEQQYLAYHVSTLRSSERLEYKMDKKILENEHALPDDVKRYVADNTREVPLWEEYKNMSRINTRPGVKRSNDWESDPNKSKWLNKY